MCCTYLWGGVKGCVKIEPAETTKQQESTTEEETTEEETTEEETTEEETTEPEYPPEVQELADNFPGVCTPELAEDLIRVLNSVGITDLSELTFTGSTAAIPYTEDTYVYIDIGLYTGNAEMQEYGLPLYDDDPDMYKNQDKNKVRNVYFHDGNETIYLYQKGEKVSSIEEHEAELYKSADEKTDDAVTMLDTVLQGGFDKKNYTIKTEKLSDDSVLFTVNVKGDGAAELAVMAATGNAAYEQKWEEFSGQFENFAFKLYQIVTVYGPDGAEIAVNMLNNQNEENYLMTSYNGTVIYDCVKD